MLKGIFFKNAPWVKIIIAWGRAIQAPFFILDTGFTGDLQVTPKIARELGLKTAGVTTVRIANGQAVQVPIALALVSMEGATSLVEVLISQSLPLAGISLLSKFGYKVTVDCKYKTVSLERV